MGSWDTSCLITQMAISPGDEVRLFFITQGPELIQHGKLAKPNGTCYNNELWAPRTCAIKATYDDYGGVIGAGPEWYIDLVMDRFRKDIIEQEQGENEYHDHAVKKDDLVGMDGFYKLLDLCQESRAYVSGQLGAIFSGPDWLGVGFVMVHEFAYQKMISDELNKTIDPYTSGKRKSTMQNKVNEHVDKIYALHALTDVSDKFAASFDIHGHGLFYHIDPLGIVGISDHMKWIEKMIEDGVPRDDKKIAQLVDIVAESIDFIFNMSAMRKHWTPMCGHGSQSDEWRAHRLLAQTVVDFCDKRENEDGW
jgi:hypothetical protein